MPEPRYARPSRSLIKESLSDAYPGQSGEYELVALRVGRLQRAEDIELDDTQESLVRAWKNTPHLISPIVVEPQGGSYVIVDGYHRYDAAIRAGMDWIWGVMAT